MKQLAPHHVLIYDGARLNIFHANKSEGLPMHGHIYSHAIVCNSGSCLVTLENGKSVIMTKNTTPINLLANIQHEIEALEDETVFVNVFSESKY
jgi:quercetin dioxygenase-like cupin family protein